MNRELMVLIPAYNEADRIGATISALQSIAEVDKIVVINDGSTDQTAQVVKELGVRLINLESNQGKGKALNKGLQVVDAELVCLIDADLGSSAGELTKLLKPLGEGVAEMTIASFPAPEVRGGFGLVTNLARWGIKYFTGFEALSPLSGQRVLSREVLEYLGEFAPGFGVETEMTIRALQGGFEVLEVPVQMKHRESGRDCSGFKHRGRQFKDVGAVLWRQFRGE